MPVNIDELLPTAKEISRWENEAVLEAVQARLVRKSGENAPSPQTVEHLGTIKSWMGSTHFQMKTLKHLGTEWRYTSWPTT